MSAAGFVLVGGKSRRMGRDKALLPWKSGLLVEDLAGRLRKVVDQVTLLGAPERYGHLGFRCLADLRPGLGPLAGIETALASGQAEWNLVLACDVPNVGVDHLRALYRTAECSGNARCVVTVDADGALQPLCAMYRDTCLPTVQQALNTNQLCLMDVVERLGAGKVFCPSRLHNVNTEEDWNAVRFADVHS